jgi:hypothetical protein
VVLVYSTFYKGRQNLFYSGVFCRASLGQAEEDLEKYILRGMTYELHGDILENRRCQGN